MVTCRVRINQKGQFLKQVNISLTDLSARCGCPAGKTDGTICAHVLSIMMLKKSDELDHAQFHACAESAAKRFAAAIPWMDRPRLRGKLAMLNDCAC